MKNIKRTVLFCAVFLCISFVCKAQLWDDFTDGDLTNNPVWLGNTDSFRVNSSFELQLNASAAGKAYLALPMSLLNEDMEWRFWIRENFAPSANNFARFYLTSDREDLSDTALQGYYLRFGENLASDAVRLYRQQGNLHTLLCSATEAAIANSFAIYVKATRSVEGEWVLYCSANGDSVLTEEIRCTDTVVSSMNYTGLYCQYTLSNRSNFYFDDIYCGKVDKDTLSPWITEVVLNETTKNEIEITFNEAVDSVSSLSVTHFDVQLVGNPAYAAFADEDHTVLVLYFDNPFPVNTPLLLSVQDITDMTGNTMHDTVFNLLLYQSQLFDVVISEIMAKPSPAVGLPDAEYIELRNRNNFPVDLTGWQLRTGTTTRTFGNSRIAANGYLLVTSVDNASLFSGYGDVVALSGLEITDAGQTVRLSDKDGNPIHFVSFSNAWHSNDAKKNGGWSLEIIDVLNPCEEQNNWTSSQDNRGGTPCMDNSVSRYNPDLSNPELEKVISETYNELTVWFTEPILPEKSGNKQVYRLSHALQIDSILSVSDNMRSVRVRLSEDLKQDVIYTLTVTDTLTDCVGNPVPLQSFVSFDYKAPLLWDDFTDGDLTNDPVWLGNTDSFSVNSDFELQLNASAAGKAYLALPMNLLNEDMEWRFWIRENFAPSNTNFAKFYLTSDREDLSDTALQGYYLQFGENLASDAVRLYRQQGNLHTLLCSATEAAIANSFAIYVKATRSVEGEWVLYCSANGGSVLTEEIRCTDTVVSSMNYTGLYCQYTVSNRTNFYFDDIYCGKIYTDTLSPWITKVVLNETTKNEIEITFNEAVDSVSSLSVTHFDVQPVGNPTYAAFADEDHTVLVLYFDNPFPVNTSLLLSVQGIADMAGNTMHDTVFNLLLYQSQLFDVVISEIMAKPSPAVGLPDAEYIELRNRNNFPVDLTGWQLQTGTTMRTFGDSRIAANGYLLAVSVGNASLFSGYGNVVSLSGLQITDAGQTVRLSDKDGNLIHFVSFSNSWHSNDVKKNGGWSLEIIDVLNPCEEQNNWTSSQDNRGGTPCMDNSVSRYNPDRSNPELEKVISETYNELTVWFTEPILPEKSGNKQVYRLSHALQIDSILSVSDNMRSVRVKLSEDLKQGVIYTLTITDTLTDCVGNLVSLQSFVSFGYALPPLKDEVIINEVLFNPKDEGVDFVEIYNRSSKIIDLRTLRLSTYKNDGSIDSGKIVSEAGTQLFPEQYMVLTTNPAIVQQQYYCPYRENFIGMNSLPVYSNTGGTVILLSDTVVIDMFTYSEIMHYPLLKSYDGVSLERINFDRPTQDEFNWHSASTSAGYATPGYRNSSYSDNIEQTSYFEVYPDIFSPDNDAYNDYVNIAYSFPQPGYRASIYIYNVAGNRLRTLVNNQLLETEGYFTWDGTIEGNIKASIGTYILLIEYWNLSGEVKRVKKTCTLAIKF